MPEIYTVIEKTERCMLHDKGDRTYVLGLQCPSRSSFEPLRLVVTEGEFVRTVIGSTIAFRIETITPPPRAEKAG